MQAMNDPWTISPAEHQQNLAGFQQMAPSGRMVGETARAVLGKSGLPPQILAQIWQLSDIDRDGALDAREYSIAMKLCRNRLAGLPLPPSLPPSMCGTMAGMGHMNMTGGMVPPPQMSMSMQHTPSQQYGMGMPIQQKMSTSSMGGMGSPPMMQAPPPPMAAFNTAPAGMGLPPLPAMPPPAGMPNPATTGRQLGNWAVPQQAKLKYMQQFNQHDKNREGFLSGAAARSILGHSGLPTPALALIWQLSDVNKDGRLSSDEFALAMHFIEMHKQGYALPSELPPELGGRDGAATPQHVEPIGQAPAQKTPTPVTFEDKRRDNLNRGQAELERRRQVLEEEENRRRAEVERKEREEMEKRERERMERERQREQQRQAEMARQAEIAAAEQARREEAEKKREEERQRKAKEAEDRHRVELEKQRLKNMQEEKQREVESTAQRQQRAKTLAFQLQACDEKRDDVNQELDKSRGRIEEITRDIEGMRGARDEKLAKIAALKEKNQQHTSQMSVVGDQLAHQLLQMQSANKDATSLRSQIEDAENRKDAATKRNQELREQIETTRQRKAAQKELLEKKRSEMESSKPRLTAARDEYTQLLRIIDELQRNAREKVEAHMRSQKAAAGAPAAESASADAWAASPAADTASQQQSATAAFVSSGTDAFGSPHFSPQASVDQTTVAVPSTASGGPSAQLPAASGLSGGTVKYRAMYEFLARGEDELSFQPGDVILVFEGHASEPGWLAGQIRDKVGWFPSAFAEPIAPVNTSIQSPMQSVPSNVTPSPSLEKILEEPAAAVKQQAHALITSGSYSDSLGSPSAESGVGGVGVGGAPTDSVILTAIAQFPWKAKNSTDLSFAKGDVIEVLEQQEMKWRGRTAAGAVGWFPKSYVKAKQDSVQSANSSTASTVVAAAAAGGSGAGTPTKAATPVNGVTPSASSLSGVSASQSQHSLGEAIMPAGGEWFVAMFDFEAVETTDLPLKTGDRVYVLEQSDQWWKGRIGQREGIFPANYVQKAQAGEAPTSPVAAVASPVILEVVKAIAAFEASAENQLSLSVGDVIRVREKSDAGWWEGETDRNGSVVAGWFPGNYVQQKGLSGSSSAASDEATALFDYTASQADELTFKAGDRVHVTMQQDADWWTGYVVGDASTTLGLFPSAYVELMR